MNDSQNNCTTVWVVNVPERIDGIYVFATEAGASEFAAAVGSNSCTVTKEPVNESGYALVEAERDE